MQDSNLYLIFNNEELAITANAQIRSNLAKLIAQNERDGKVWNDFTDTEVNLSAVANEVLMSDEYPILSRIQGVETKTDGHTDFWGTVQEKYNQAGQFFIPKPITSLMTGVVGVIATEPYSQDWFPPSIM